MTRMRRTRLQSTTVDEGNRTPLGKWRAVAESVVGTQHEADGRICEDASSVTRIKRSDGTEIISICVCDGAGSVQYGGEGAHITSKVVGEYLVEHFEQFLEDSEAKTKQLVDIVQATLRQEAVARTSELRLFACTLVAVCCESQGRWIAFHLGDGGIFAKLDGEVTGISLPMKGEHVNTTFFVTDKDAAERIDFFSFLDFAAPGKATAFMLFSDGVENLLITHKTGEIATAACSMMEWLEKFSEDEVSQGLQSQLQEVFRVRSSDDCTIGLMGLVEFEPPSDLARASETFDKHSEFEPKCNQAPDEPLHRQPANELPRRTEHPKTRGEHSISLDDELTPLLWNAVFIALGFILGVVVCARFPNIVILIQSGIDW